MKKVTANLLEPGAVLASLNLGPITFSQNVSVTGTLSLSGNFTVDGTTFFVDAANNRVGILTTAPAYPLDVAGTIRSAGQFLNSAGGYFTSGEIFSPYDLAIKLSYSGVTSTRMFIRRDNGNVGIGLTDPNHNLVVSGTTTTLCINGTSGAYLIMDGNGGQGYGLDYTTFAVDTGGNFSITNFKSTGTISLKTNNIERFRITADGNTGVGVNPLAKFHVLSTTEQLRLGYDDARYMSVVVGSTGGVTFSNAGTATDPWTFVGNVVATGPNSRFPNQTPATGDSPITRQFVEQLVASYIAGAGRKWHRLAGITNGNQGSGSTSAVTAAGAVTAAAGNVINAKAYAMWENGMSWQSGSGARWYLPSKFMFSGFGSFLMQHETCGVTGVTSGANTFSYWAASASHVGRRIWSSAFPEGTYITGVSGTTVTVSQAATATVSGRHYLVMCYEGHVALCLCGATNSMAAFGYNAPFAADRHLSLVGHSPGATSIRVYCNISSTAGWVAGNDYITLTATNSNVAVGMLISGNGLPSDVRVRSISGTTIYLRDAAGNPVTVAGSNPAATVGFMTPSYNGWYLLGEGIADNTTFTISNDTTSGSMYFNLSTPTVGAMATNGELFIVSSDTNSNTINNAVWWEYLPRPDTGICGFRLCAMRGGFIYRSEFVNTETGPIDTWQQYFNFVLDYDEATLTLRLFVTEQPFAYQATPRPSVPVATLTLPAGLANRHSGMYPAAFACSNSRFAPATTTMCRIAVNRLDYFMEQTYLAF